jgi:type IV pilus assembly protein PilW
MIDPTNAGFDPNAEILAVRVWLRLRGERVENGLIDNTDYEYADQDFGIFNDGFRRVVVSKTIYLRNARPAS